MTPLFWLAVVVASASALLGANERGPFSSRVVIRSSTCVHGAARRARALSVFFPVVKRAFLALARDQATRTWTWTR